MSRIILIDDDHDLLTMLERGFKKRNYQVSCAQNSRDVQTLLSEYDFEEAVLDLNLNGESGLDILPLLLTHNPKIQIVVTTGYASLHTAVDAIKQGACNYLSKPVLIDDIINALQGKNISSKSTVAHQDLKTKEWEHIQYTLKKNNFNISETAKELGYHRRTLQRKLQKKPF